jgi:flagellar basal-body rod protein FlgC
MDLFNSLHTSASALSAQRLRMNLISSNLANIHTTRTQTGEPYRRKDAVFAASSPNRNFHGVLNSLWQGAPTGVRVVGIFEDPTPAIPKYDPNHPDADARGYVQLPNINLMEEMVNMISASRSYEANVAAIRATKSMFMKALEIGR